MATEEKIRELAYSLWEQEGRPDGNDQEYYFRASQILVEQDEAISQETSNNVEEVAKPRTRKRTTKASATGEAPAAKATPRKRAPRTKKS